MRLLRTSSCDNSTIPIVFGEARRARRWSRSFCQYSNDVFSFYVFHFRDVTNYNSIELVLKRKYQIGAREIELEDIVAALERVQVLPEPPGVPFPQADSFNRVIDLLTQLQGAGIMSQEDVTTNHAFDLRQTQYYTNAGRYLALVRDGKRGTTALLTH